MYNNDILLSLRAYVCVFFFYHLFQLQCLTIIFNFIFFILLYIYIYVFLVVYTKRYVYLINLTNAY